MLFYVTCSLIKFLFMRLCFILHLFWGVCVCVLFSRWERKAGCRWNGKVGIQESCSQKVQEPELGCWCVCIFLVAENLHLAEGLGSGPCARPVGMQASI